MSYKALLNWTHARQESYEGLARSSFFTHSRLTAARAPPSWISRAGFSKAECRDALWDREGSSNKHSTVCALTNYQNI